MNLWKRNGTAYQDTGCVVVERAEWRSALSVKDGTPSSLNKKDKLLGNRVPFQTLTLNT
jgi:hypothetical protein